jgi:hypothetical protein
VASSSPAYSAACTCRERYLNLSEDLPEAERINDNTADQNVLT